MEQGSQTRHEDTGFVVRKTFERSLEPGEVVYEEGQAGDAMFVIHAGQVELLREGPDGPRVVSRLGPGDVFGEMSVLLGRDRTSRAIAVGRSQVLQLDAGTFEALCIEQPEVAIRMIKRLAARVTDLERRLALIGADDLIDPVVHAILARSEPSADGGLQATLTLRSLADAAGLSLGEAHRALGQLIDRKLVRIVDDQLQVPDPASLEAVLDASD